MPEGWVLGTQNWEPEPSLGYFSTPVCTPAPFKLECKAYTIQFLIATAATAKSLQSCPTLCSPIDGSPPGSPVPGILQARTLEWVAISFSNA